MPNKYALSKKADQDIKAILQYSYRQFSENQAWEYKTTLGQCLQLLADNPDLGGACEWLRAGYRRHGHVSHVIYYKKRVNDIFVARILHKSRNAKQHL